MRGYIARRVAVAVFLAACLLAGFSMGASCNTPQPPPPPTPPPPALLSGDQVTAELVDGGCLAPGTSSAVIAELLDVDAHDQGLRQSIVCLFEGGTIASCNTPCERAGIVRRPDK